jgi:HEPN domain-containing protein
MGIFDLLPKKRQKRRNLNNKVSGNELKKFIEDQLPIFDEILADTQKPLSERPLAAALYFVNYCVVEIKGDNKENFLEKEWFKSIYKLIKQWYEDRYTNAMNFSKDSFATAVVLIYKTPFQLKIPLSIAQEWEGNEKRWFCIPNSILDNENVIDWITNRPNLENMSEDDLEVLKKTICNIATSTREIHVNLMSACLEQELCKISNTIPAHLDKAVRDILSLEKGRISASYWEIHLAIEKAIKLIILQNGCDHKNKHNLETLRNIANNISGISLDRNIFSGFLSDKDAIEQRYGEGKSFTVQEAANNYSSANEVISKLTKLLKRKFVMNNARFLITIPPWEKTEPNKKNKRVSIIIKYLKGILKRAVINK